MIRAIFFDIDGTMVSYKNKIMSQQLRDDLFALQRAGIRIFVCSGRAPRTWRAPECCGMWCLTVTSP